MKNKRKQAKQQQQDMYMKFDEFEIPEFPATFRGYDKYEVDKYLNTLADAYNKMYEEHIKALAELDEYRRKKDAIAEAVIALKITGETEIPETSNDYFELDAPETAPRLYEFFNNENADINDLLKNILAKSGGS